MNRYVAIAVCQLLAHCCFPLAWCEVRADVAANVADDAAKDTWQQRQRRLWDAWQEQTRRSGGDEQWASQLAASDPLSPQTFFLPARREPPARRADGHAPAAAAPRDQQLANYFADALTRLAQKAADAGEPKLGYRLLNQAALFAPKGLAGRVVLGRHADTQHRLTRNARGTSRSPWRTGQFLRVQTPHYQLDTNCDEQQAREIANQLEDLYAVWRQLFFEFWADGPGLRRAIKSGRQLKPRFSSRHRVVLFATHDEYVRFLRRSHRRIEITKGFYDTTTHIAYFSADAPDSLSATLFHEATHQLFQGNRGTVNARAGLHDSFWALEGIALYMESLQIHGRLARLGGPGSERLQYARYRVLQEEFYLPLSNLVSMGRDQIQQHPEIGKLYSQSAGLTHFFLDAQQYKYRSAFIRFLQSVYANRARGALPLTLDVPLDQLDAQYKAYLNLNDRRLLAALPPANSLRALNLGRTTVSSAAIQQLPTQAGLGWLDLAFTPATDEALAFAKPARGLRQLSLQGTRITDRLGPWLGELQNLEELDLSHTTVTAAILKDLAGHPRLSSLWLNGTQVNDTAIEVLLQLKQLTRLGIADSSISDAGRQRLKSANARLVLE